MAIRERPDGQVDLAVVTVEWSSLADTALSKVSSWHTNDAAEGSGFPQNRAMVVVTANWLVPVGASPKLDFYLLSQTTDIGGTIGGVNKGPPGVLIGTVDYTIDAPGSAIEISSPAFDLPMGGFHIRVKNRTGAAFPATVTALVRTWTPTRADD